MARNYSTEIQNAIEEFFAKDDWKYEPMDENGVFRTGVAMNSKLKSLKVYIDVKQAGLSIISVLPVNADEETRPAVAEFITRANYGLYIGNFEMDYSDGEIRYKSSLPCPDVIPTFEQIKELMYTNFITVDRYGNGIMKVLFGMAEPKEAIEESERKQD